MFKHVPLIGSRSISARTLQNQAKIIDKRHAKSVLQSVNHKIVINKINERFISLHARLYSTAPEDEGPWADLDARLDNVSIAGKEKDSVNFNSPKDIQSKAKTWSEYMGVENDVDSPWASLDAFADGNRDNQRMLKDKPGPVGGPPSMSDWEEAAVAAADAYAARQIAGLESSSKSINQVLPRLTHIDEHQNDRAAMVDVSSKQESKRIATATCRVFIPEHVLPLLNSTQPMIEEELTKTVRLKGPVMHTAQLAGIMAAKKTSELIPLCHGLNLSHVDVQLKVRKMNEEELDNVSESALETFIEVTCITTTTGQTGVEMEALTGASVASLTLWDMLKSVAGKEMRIDGLMVTQKSGGKSGDWERTM